MNVINLLAQAIGYVILGAALILFIITLCSSIFEAVRNRFPKFDLWLYDDNARWNSKCRSISKP
jgi:hypothetical protein